MTKRSNQEIMDDLVELLKAMPEDRRDLFLRNLDEAAEIEEQENEQETVEQA
jgi:hypothetical protein